MRPEPRTFHYPLQALMPDYLRSAAGVAITAGPLPWLSGGVTFVLGGLALVFAGFGLVTWMRQRTVVTIGPSGIRADGPRTMDMPWTGIDRVDLRYFGSRRQQDRDQSKGWMQLRVDGGGRKLRIDSQIDGFGDLMHGIAAAIEHHEIPVTEIGRENFASLGLSTGPDRPDRETPRS